MCNAKECTELEMSIFFKLGPYLENVAMQGMQWTWSFFSILHSLELELIARTNVIWFVFRPLEVGAFISSWGHILPPPFLLRFNNITDSRNDQVLIDFILLSLLVNLYKQKNSSYHGLGIFFEIFEIFELVFKNCLLFVSAWQDGKIKRKKNTASCYLD